MTRSLMPNTCHSSRFQKTCYRKFQKPHYFHLSILVSSGQLCETNKQKNTHFLSILLRRSHLKVSKKQPWLSQDSPVNLLWEKSIFNQVKPIFNPDYSEFNLFPSLIIHRGQRKFLDSHRLQGQTGNYGWKIKWFAPISFQRIWAVNLQ